MNELRPRARIYFATIVVMAAAAGLLAAFHLTGIGWPALARGIAVAGLTALAYRFPLLIDANTRFHLDTAVIVAAVLMLEPGLAIPAVALGTLVGNIVSLYPQDIGGWVQGGFNAAQTALQAATGGLILVAAGWDPAAPDFGDPPLLAAIALAGAAMHLVNTLAVATIIAFQSDERPLRIWLQSSAVMDRAEALAHLAQLGLGLLAAIVADAQSWALLLLLLPAAAVYSGLQGHVRLRRGIERRLAVAQEIAHLGSWEWDVGSDTHVWSDEVFRILGYAPRSFDPSRRAFLEAVHPDDRLFVREALTGVAEGTERSFEHRVRRPDGTVRVVQLIGELQFDARGHPTRVLGTLHDITERKALEDRLAHRAFHDPLTDLPNRALFEDRLAQAVARADRHRQALAVLYLDLDGFKAVNDQFGHDVGDELLVAVAARLRESIRLEDTVARRGGDEFTILVEDLTVADEAERIAHRLIETIAGPYRLASVETEVGASIGVVFRAPGDHRAAAALIADADLALYRAKHAGKGRHVLVPAGESELTAVLSA